jgi:hypothetical protein
MSNPDSTFGRFTPEFFDSNGNAFPGPAYRPQDEYLERIIRRDRDGTITELALTCAGPEF